MEYVVYSIIMYTKKIRDRARKLREEGISYNQLQRTLGIPKSTLSSWFSKSLGMPFDRGALLKHLAKVRVLAAKAKTRIRLEELKSIQLKIQDEVITYPIHKVGFQKSLVSMLYWAEGTKHEKVGGLKFTNTDPRLVRLFVELLKNSYDINPSLFRIGLHIHYYHKIKTVRKFWSSYLKIPESQFNYIYIKKRSHTKRFRRNFMGICIVSYPVGKIRKEIMALAYELGNCLTPKSSVKI